MWNTSCRMRFLSSTLFHSLEVYCVREMGDPSSRKSYLPADKQFLITRNGTGNFSDAPPLH
jgi:hypothetical protein